MDLKTMSEHNLTIMLVLSNGNQHIINVDPNYNVNKTVAVFLKLDSEKYKFQVSYEDNHISQEHSFYDCCIYNNSRLNVEICHFVKKVNLDQVLNSTKYTAIVVHVNADNNSCIPILLDRYKLMPNEQIFKLHEDGEHASMYNNLEFVRTYAFNGDNNISNRIQQVLSVPNFNQQDWTELFYTSKVQHYSTYGQILFTNDNRVIKWVEQFVSK